ncbi:MAG TPA: DinB family protein [Candidatus Dormibacteraeota bacterium]|nr:DinB family protein [Candidatus Dormibacteraeota bacterium]
MSRSAERHELSELFRYHAWANDRTLAAFEGLGAELDEPAPGTMGTIRKTLGHLTLVEEGFLLGIEGRSLEVLGDRERYVERDPAWYRERLAEVGRRYRQFLESADEAGLERELRLSWLPFGISVRQVLRQVLVHSAHHRSQVLSWLGARGRTAPDLDYVLMLAEERGG